VTDFARSQRIADVPETAFLFDLAALDDAGIPWAVAPL
jgi:hypothetical protein